MDREKDHRRNSVPSRLLLLLLLLLAVAGCGGGERAKLEHLKRGEEMLVKKRYLEAALEFRSAQQLDEKSSDAYWGMSRAYEGSGNMEQAMNSLRRAVDLNPGNLEAQVKLGNYALLANQNTEARSIARQILSTNPNHIEAHVLLASSYFVAKQTQEAFQELNRALELDPKRIETHIYLADFHSRTGDTAKAEESLRMALSIDDKSSKAHIAYGNFLNQRKRLTEAETEFRRAVDLDPDDRQVHFTLGGFYVATNQLEKAEGVYKGVAEREQDYPEGGAALGTFYSTVGRTDEALKKYREVINKFPDYDKGRLQLAEMLLQTGDATGAVEQAEELLKSNPQSLQPLLMRARARLLAGKFKESVADLQGVLDAEPRHRDALLLITDAYLSWGKYEEASSSANSFVTHYPSYTPALIQQARAYMAVGDSKAALKTANAALEQLPKSGNAPQKNNDSLFIIDMRANALTWRGMAKANLGDMNGANADLQEALRLAPHSAPAYANFARAKFTQSAGEATRLYERALELNSNNLSALSDLSEIYINQKRGGDALAHIDRALARDNSSAKLHLLKGVVYNTQGKVHEAEDEFRRAKEADPNNVNAYYETAALFVRTNQPMRALDEYKQLEKRDLATARTYTLMGVIEESRTDYDAAVTYYRKALEMNGADAVAANNLAWLYAEYDKGPLFEAAQLAQSAVEKNPQIPNFLHTSGYVYRKLKMYKQSVIQLQKAVALEKGNAAHHVQLGLAFADLGDKDGARRELEQGLRLPATGNPKQYEEARRVLATL